MDLRSKLLKAAHSYCETAGIQLSTLSTRVRNDGKFFDSIADGRSCNIDTYEDVMKWFSQNPPIKKSNPKNRRSN